MKKLSEEKVNAFIEDEKMASEEYGSLGYSQLSKDEARHHKFWLKKRKEWYGY